MAKITPANVLQLGFDKGQFGDPSNWAGAGGYLAAIISDQAAAVARKLGSTYTSPSADQLNIIKQGELFLVEAELWRRLSIFSLANHSLQNSETGEPINFKSRAETAQSKAQTVLGEIQTQTFTGLATGIVISPN